MLGAPEEKVLGVIGKVLRRMALLTVIGLTPIAASAQAPAAGAEIPYAALHAALAPAVTATGNPRLQAIKVVESKLGVPPERIRIVIKARGGDRVFTPRPDGSMDFPLDESLLAENPLVTTNQPKGSLSLSVTLALRPPPGARMPLAEIDKALADIESALAPAGQAALDGRIRGVEVRFPAGAHASLTLRDHEGERLFMADAAGRVILMRDTDLAGAGEVEFSQRPTLILPYLDR